MDLSKVKQTTALVDKLSVALDCEVEDILQSLKESKVIDHREETRILNHRNTQLEND